MEKPVFAIFSEEKSLSFWLIFQYGEISPKAKLPVFLFHNFSRMVLRALIHESAEFIIYKCV